MAGSKVEELWLNLLETEDALVPEGLHIIGKSFSDAARVGYLDLLDGVDPTRRVQVDQMLKEDHELPALMRALSGRFIAPMPRGFDPINRYFAHRAQYSCV